MRSFAKSGKVEFTKVEPLGKGRMYHLVVLPLKLLKGRLLSPPADASKGRWGVKDVRTRPALTTAFAWPCMGSIHHPVCVRACARFAMHGVSRSITTKLP